MAGGIVVLRDTYRGWHIGPDVFGWTAISPNYDASWEGEESGWRDNGEKAWGRTRAECEEAVDEWFDEFGTEADHEAHAAEERAKLADHLASLPAERQAQLRAEWG
jgi:hypothetical protein